MACGLRCGHASPSPISSSPAVDQGASWRALLIMLPSGFKSCHTFSKPGFPWALESAEFPYRAASTLRKMARAFGRGTQGPEHAPDKGEPEDLGQSCRRGSPGACPWSCQPHPCAGSCRSDSAMCQKPGANYAWLSLHPPQDLASPVTSRLPSSS